MSYHVQEDSNLKKITSSDHGATQQVIVVEICPAPGEIENGVGGKV